MKWDQLLPGQRESVIEKLRAVMDVAKKDAWGSSYIGERANSDVVALEAAIEKLEAAS